MIHVLAIHWRYQIAKTRAIGRGAHLHPIGKAIISFWVLVDELFRKRIPPKIHSETLKIHVYALRAQQFTFRVVLCMNIGFTGQKKTPPNS
jgi:hypothetical protein